ncbi:MAG: thiolase domain-containing protein [Thermoproteota archaeon]|nr:MAG: thiolase domain-containing protein [Candidatus Korarchaeota archaeon]
MRRVFVVGAGLTKVGQHWDRSLKDLLAEAGLKAMEDAGVDEVEAIFVGNMMSGILNGQESLGSLAADYLGLTGVPAFKVEAACASGGAALMQGVLAVKSGLFDRVLVVGVEKMTDATDTADVTSGLATAADFELELFFGASFVSLNALVMRLYASEHGLSEEEFGHLPILMHKNAVDVEHAQLRFEINMEKYLDSPYVAEPIRLLDSSPIGDGAAAVVLSAGSSPPSDRSVEVAGFWSATETLALCDREDLLRPKSIRAAVRKALEMAGLEIGDVSVVQIHDAFSIVGYLCIEGAGLAEPGRAPAFIESGEANRDGSIPINPEGGLKARGHPVGATGIYQVVELYRQLLGEAGPSQVEGARHGLAINVGGVASNVVAHVLRRVD